MEEKPIDWRGSSLRDIKDDDIFTPGARRKPVANLVKFKLD